MLLSRGGEWYSERHGSCSMSASFREVRPCGLLRNNIMAMHGCGTLARLNLLYSTRPIFCSVPPSLVIRSRPPALWHAPRCPLTFGQLGTHGPFTPPSYGQARRLYIGITPTEMAHHARYLTSVLSRTRFEITSQGTFVAFPRNFPWICGKITHHARALLVLSTGFLET